MKYAIAALLAAAGCTTTAPQFGPAAPPSVSTTYFPYDDRDAQSMGPGHFTCSWLNDVKDWYLAPSDTFGDELLWSGPPCPPGRPYPDCQRVQKTCGTKVKIRCAANCRAGAPEVVAMITDYCPIYHPQNRQSGACQGGPHFDISKSIWKLMRDRDDNIRVTYEVVGPDAVLGPTWTWEGAQ